MSIYLLYQVTQLLKNTIVVYFVWATMCPRRFYSNLARDKAKTALNSCVNVCVNFCFVVFVAPKWYTHIKKRPNTHIILAFLAP